MTIYKAANYRTLLPLFIAIPIFAVWVYFHGWSKYEDIFVVLILGAGMFFLGRFITRNYAKTIEFKDNQIDVELQNGKKVTFTIESIQSMGVEGYGVTLKLQDQKSIVLDRTLTNYYDLLNKLESFNLKKKQPLISNKLWTIIIAIIWFLCAFASLIFGIMGGMGIHPVAYYINALVSFLLGIFSIWLFKNIKE